MFSFKRKENAGVVPPLLVSRPPNGVAALVVEGRCDPKLPLVVANLRRRLPLVPVLLLHNFANQRFVEQDPGFFRQPGYSNS